MIAGMHASGWRAEGCLLRLSGNPADHLHGLDEEFLGILPNSISDDCPTGIIASPDFGLYRPMIFVI